MTEDLFSVEGQVVLVSGGSRGIGRAIAQGFAERRARVIISSRDQQTLARTAGEIAPEGGEVRWVVCDVARPGDITALVETVLGDFGRIDTLINVAGVNRRKPSLEVTDEDYDFILDINLKGAFLLSRAVGEHMVRERRGRQINVASLNSDRPLKNVLPYAMSKAGMGHMTRALALEWGEHGVNVNALAPGFVLTDLTRELWSDETMRAWGESNTPQRRLGVPEDMVGTAIFLASEASRFLTGQVIHVDGGFTAGWTWPIPQ